MQAREALTRGFQTWLDAGLPAENSALRAERIDPYATSSRTCEIFVEGLKRIEAGTFGSWNARPAQRATDMRAAALLSGDANNATATRLGNRLRETLESRELWDQVGNEAKQYEFPRNVALVQTAMRLGVSEYRGWMRNWRELRSVRSADEWFDDEQGLVLALYLRHTRAGYNPFAVMISAGVPPWDNMPDLRAWATDMAAPPGWSASRLSVLLDGRVNDAVSRLRGRLLFIKAMEAVLLAQEGTSTAALETKLNAWKVDSV